MKNDSSSIPTLCTTGPLTIAGHLVGTENLLLWIITNPEAVHKVIKLATKLERAYIGALAKAGADVIVMSDPSAGTDMLSPDMFDEYAAPYIKEAFADAGHAKKVLHICGDTDSIISLMPSLSVAVRVTRCAPVVSVINYILMRRAQFGRLVIVQGVKHPQDLIWRERYAYWRTLPHTEVWLAADHSKFNRPAMVELATLSQIDRLFTDKPPPELDSTVDPPTR